MQAEGFVHDFNDSMIKICLNDEPDFQPLQEVTAFIFNRVKGECVYKGLVADEEGKNIILKNINFVSSTQKRNNTRVNKTFRYRITHKYVDGECSRIEKLDKPIDIAILNISAKGMLIICGENLAIGHRFPFTFIDAGAPINLEVEVIRSEKSRRGNRYGCAFVNISQKDEDNIFRLVLHEQIEQRRRNLVP